MKNPNKDSYIYIKDNRRNTARWMERKQYRNEIIYIVVKEKEGKKENENTRYI